MSVPSRLPLLVSLALTLAGLLVPEVTPASELSASTKAHRRQRASIGDRHGTLVLIGGGLTPDNREIYDAVKRHLGLPPATNDRPTRPRIALIPSSKGSLHDAWSDFFLDDPTAPASSPSYRKWFSQAGFTPVLVPLALDTVFGPLRAAEDPRNVDLIRSCEVVFLQGGDQARHVQCLKRPDGSDTPVLSAIRELYAAGGVVIGTSAGTHALADPMYGWGESGPALHHGQLDAWTLDQLDPQRELEPRQPGNSIRMPGLGLLPAGFLSDTHFDARGRLGRLTAALRDTSARWGIGVDEDTALFIEQDLATVAGHNGVFLIDATAARFSPPGEPLQVDGLRLSYLLSGDTWNIRDGSLRPKRFSTASNTVATGKAQNPDPVPVVLPADPFSEDRLPDGDRRTPCGATRVLKHLATLPAVEAVSRPPHPFTLRFRRDADSGIISRPPHRFSLFRLAFSIMPTAVAGEP